MRAVLPRTGSVPVLSHTASAGSPRVSLSRHDSTGCVFSGAKGSVGSPRISLHFNINHRKDSPAPARGIRRAVSESDIIRSEIGLSKLSGAGSLSFPARIPEDVYLSETDDEGEQLVSNGPGIWPEIGIPLEELGFAGGGFGGGGKSGSGGYDGIGSGDDRSKIGAYYLEMLKSNPGDSLLLRNYGKFLHEVEKDTVRAEEFYGRAILASPGDGELLSLYGKLIWDTQRDGDRAKSYFDQAVHASPDDCMVLGSYAQFMWEAEEEEDDTNEIKDRAEASPALVAAF